MSHSSKEAEICGILFDNCDEKIRALLFSQSALEQIWSVSRKCIKSDNQQMSKNLQKKRIEKKVGPIRRLFIDDPGRSIRNASSASGLSYTLVRDILHKDLNFKPWKPKSVQELFPEDMNRTLGFMYVEVCLEAVLSVVEANMER